MRVSVKGIDLYSRLLSKLFFSNSVILGNFDSSYRTCSSLIWLHLVDLKPRDVVSWCIKGLRLFVRVRI